MTSIVVELLGRKIPIKTQDSEEHIRSLVEYIKNKVDEIDPDRKLPEMTLAILTMLNLGDDLFKERAKFLELKEAVRTKSSFLLEKLEQNRYIC